MIQGKRGTIRSYYYDDLNVKTILNSNAGTAEYDLGRVTLRSFNPVSVDDTDGFLRFNARPKTLTFRSQRQSLTTIDEFDFNAINVTLSVSS